MWKNWLLIQIPKGSVLKQDVLETVIFALIFPHFWSQKNRSETIGGGRKKYFFPLPPYQFGSTNILWRNHLASSYSQIKQIPWWCLRKVLSSPMPSELEMTAHGLIWKRVRENWWSNDPLNQAHWNRLSKRPLLAIVPRSPAVLWQGHHPRRRLLLGFIVCSRLDILDRLPALFGEVLPQWAREMWLSFQHRWSWGHSPPPSQFASSPDTGPNPPPMRSTPWPWTPTGRSRIRLFRALSTPPSAKGSSSVAFPPPFSHFPGYWCLHLMILLIRYLSWDDYFMALAFLSAKRSKDPNRQVTPLFICIPS